MAALLKSRRLPTVFTLGVGGLSPPVTEYAKLPSHAIYYYSGTPNGTAIAALAKYTSISTSLHMNAGGTQWGNAARSIVAINPASQFFGYLIASEVGFPSTDIGGSFGNPAAKLTAADWLLRSDTDSFYITYGSGDGTFLPDRGAWVSATSYAVNDVVLQGGVYYKCITPNSDVSFTGAKWTTALGTMAVNYLNAVLPDHAGLNWATYYAKYAKTLMTRDTSGWAWTGVYLDSGLGYTDQSATGLDWLNNGTTQVAISTPAVKRKMEEFGANYVTALKAEMGAGLKVFANVGDRTDGVEFSVTQGYGALYSDGNLDEKGIAPTTSWSLLCFAGVHGAPNAANTVMEGNWNWKSQAVRDINNNFSVLGVYAASATDYATFRLGIALAAMRNGRAALSSAAGGYTAQVPPWVDELDQPLGTGIDAIQSAPFSGQIWKRRFQNGVLIANQSKLARGASRGAWAPGVSYTEGEWVTESGRCRVCKHGKSHTSAASFATDDAAGRWLSMDGASTPNYIAGAPVTIDNTIIPYGIYKRFSGTQDPVTNSGAVVNGSFSLAGWDAILLLCVTPGVHS